MPPDDGPGFQLHFSSGLKREPTTPYHLPLVRSCSQYPFRSLNGAGTSKIRYYGTQEVGFRSSHPPAGCDAEKAATAFDVVTEGVGFRI